MDLLEYVRNIVLGNTKSSKQLASLNQEYDLTCHETSAIINAGAINIFDSKLTVQNKQDISNSILFAQLAADNKYNRFTDCHGWFVFFIDVLNNVGWGNVSATHQTKSGEAIDWEKLVLMGMTGIASENELALSQLAMSSWQNLSLESKAMNIWDTNTVQNEYQSFQIIPSELHNGLCIVISNMSSSAQKYLNGFLSSKNIYSINENITKLILNEPIYAQVREVIIEKLGNRIIENMAKLPLNK